MRAQTMLAVLAAVASARPTMPTVDARELQYAAIQAIYDEYDTPTARAHNHARELEYAEIVDLYAEEERRGGDARRRHGDEAGDGHDAFDAFKHHGPTRGRPHGPARGHHGDVEEFEHHGPPRGHHHHHNHHQHDAQSEAILQNVVGFLKQQMRRFVPDPSAAAVDGIINFLAGETRDVHEHEHHHERAHQEPRHPHPAGHDIGNEILTFFASATK